MLRIAEQWHGTDQGRQRQGNEDNLYVRAPLFVVADGMGGAQAGEVASEMAVASFRGGLPQGPPSEGLLAVIHDANRSIYDRSQAEEQRAGMGTTVTAAFVAEDELVVAHVGDSRAYLLRGGDLVRLTRDHSLVGELIARGKLTEEEAESHPQRSVITRALGPEASVEVDVDRYNADAGDVVLLCSDGLTSMVGEAQVRDVLERAGSLEQAGRALIAAANEAGGRDNITVVLFRLESVAPADAAAAEAAAAQETVEHETLRGRTGDGGDGATASMTALRPARAPAQPIAEPAGAPDAHEGEGRRRGRRRRLRMGVGGALIAFFAVVLVLSAWMATRAVYFVGTDPRDGRSVAIFRGLPYELPAGIRLYERYAGSGVTIDAVPPARREVFTDHKLRSKDDAENLVIALERGQLDR